MLVCHIEKYRMHWGENIYKSVAKGQWLYRVTDGTLECLLVFEAANTTLGKTVIYTCEIVDYVFYGIV